MKQLTKTIFDVSKTPMQLVGLFPEQASTVITLGLKVQEANWTPQSTYARQFGSYKTI